MKSSTLSFWILLMAFMLSTLIYCFVVILLEPEISSTLWFLNYSNYIFYTLIGLEVLAGVLIGLLIQTKFSQDFQNLGSMNVKKRLIWFAQFLEIPIVLGLVLTFMSGESTLFFYLAGVNVVCYLVMVITIKSLSGLDG